MRTIKEMITDYKNQINICEKEMEHLTHPEKYGCCLDKCNCIVINKERLMTVTTDDNNQTSYEFKPLNPTYFSPDTARRIVKEDIFKDCNGKSIKMEIIGKLEYYRLLKIDCKKSLEILKLLS